MPLGASSFVMKCVLLKSLGVYLCCLASAMASTEWKLFSPKENISIAKKLDPYLVLFNNYEAAGVSEKIRLAEAKVWQKRLTKISGIEHDFGEEGAIYSHKFDTRSQNGVVYEDASDNRFGEVSKYTHGYNGSVYYLYDSVNKRVIAQGEKFYGIVPSYKEILTGFLGNPFNGTASESNGLLKEILVSGVSEMNIKNVAYIDSEDSLKIRVQRIVQKGAKKVAIEREHIFSFIKDPNGSMRPDKYTADKIFVNDDGVPSKVPEWEIVFSEFSTIENKGVSYSVPMKIEGVEFGTVTDSIDGTLEHDFRYTQPVSVYPITKLVYTLDSFSSTSGNMKLDFPDVFSEGVIVVDRVIDDVYQLGNPLE